MEIQGGGVPVIFFTMYDFITKIIAIFSEWNWSEILKICISAWMAYIATRALQNWKRQSKAQQKTEFLDRLTDAVHEFIAHIATPVEMIGNIKIGIECYGEKSHTDLDRVNPGTITYIQKHGEEDAKKLYEYLKPCTLVLSKIQSLVAKGQVFGLKNYPECQKSCGLIIAQYEKVQAFCSIIGSPSLNWDNPEVQAVLSNVLKISAADLTKQLQDQNVKFLAFVKESYGATYQ